MASEELQIDTAAHDAARRQMDFVPVLAPHYDRVRVGLRSVAQPTSRLVLRAIHRAEGGSSHVPSSLLIRFLVARDKPTSIDWNCQDEIARMLQTGMETAEAVATLTALAAWLSTPDAVAIMADAWAGAMSSGL